MSDSSVRAWLAGMLVAVGTAAGQTPAPATATTPSDKDADAMRGPRVGERKEGPTLVRRDASGKLERLEVRPEQAAVDLLKLTAEERKPVDALVTARLGKVTAVLRGNYEQFLKIQAARQGGAKPEEVRPLMREFRPAVAGLIEPTLAERVCGGAAGGAPGGVSRVRG